jgi:hypothetical protein
MLRLSLFNPDSSVFDFIVSPRTGLVDQGIIDKITVGNFTSLGHLSPDTRIPHLCKNIAENVAKLIRLQSPAVQREWLIKLPCHSFAATASRRSDNVAVLPSILFALLVHKVFDIDDLRREAKMTRLGKLIQEYDDIIIRATRVVDPVVV